MMKLSLYCRWNSFFLLILAQLSLLVCAQPAQAITITYTTNDNWIAPAGVTSVTVEAWGGGGAGGGATGNKSGGGGGAGGQYARKVITVVPGSSYEIVVGAGGNGTTNDGTDGGDSWFASKVVVAKGGDGGDGESNNNDGADGGEGSDDDGDGDTVYAGGDGSNGNDNRGGGGGGGAGSGGDGGDAFRATAGSGTAIGGGNGGAGYSSGGDNGGDGDPGSPAGGGGGGAYGRGSNQNESGGNGARGKVAITYTVIQFPTVTSITRANADPTTANTTVAWTVVFSTSVSGVDTADFVPVPTGGASGASLSAVSGVGTTWTVSADTGTSNVGTLGLNLLDNDTIIDGASLPLGGSGAGNGNTTGPVYTLLPPAPLLNKTASASAAVVGDVVTFTITATNPYDVPFTDVVITDPLPLGMSYVTHVAMSGAVSISGQTITWTIPTLPAKGSAQLTLAVSLTQQGPLINTVTSPGSTSASATILVLASAVTHFRMDEPVGSWTGAPDEVIDSGGTLLHGRRRISNSPTTTNVIDPTPTIFSQHASVIGGFCNAASFDGRAIVEVADSPNFDYTTQLSASAWIYPTAYPSSSDYYSILSNDVNYEFHISPSGKLYWWWNAATLTSATTIPRNQWTHVAITFDSRAGERRQRIYINGVLDSNTNNWQGTLAPNNCNFYIGGDVTTGSACSIMPERNFRGTIDEVKLYSFELSAAEVVADMTLGRSCSGTFDHVRIEHDGVASVCAPERVTIKACLDSSCSTLYPGNVTVNLAPAGWVNGGTFSFSGGITTRQLSISTPGNVTLGSNSVSPTPATPSRCFNGSSEDCTLNFTSASCAFDAVESGAAPQTPIFTKVAGMPFAIDVLSLLGPTTINTAFVGTVAIDLVDTTGSACPTVPGLNTAKDITFIAGDVGRKAVAFNYPGAARNVRVRAKIGASAPACSTDNFAIRPQVFTVTSSDATNTATSGAPIIKAGTAFNLTASSVPGYDGTPLLDNSKVIGTPAAGLLSGAFVPAPVATGTATGSGFSYSEVGLFGLGQNAVYDTNFTTVDQPDDCKTGFSNAPVGGKYGCSTGSAVVPLVTGSSGFGRFTPDHFLLNGVPIITNRSDLACSPASTFTYMGEPFRIEFGLEAQNVVNDRTTNYTGDYAKLDPSAFASFGFGAVSPGSATPLTTRLSGISPSGSWSDGLGSFSVTLALNRGIGLDGPFDDLAVGMAPVDTDNVAYRSDGLNFDADLNTSNERVRLATTRLRFGRLAFQNAYGSELLKLDVPFTAEYFDGSGFITNAADSCSSVPLVQLSLSSLAAGATTGINPIQVNTINLNTTTATLFNPFVAGSAGLSLSAPKAGGEGYVDLSTDLSASPWLQFDWDGNGVHNNNPTARASFGIYKGNRRLIYLREVIR